MGISIALALRRVPHPTLTSGAYHTWDMQHTPRMPRSRKGQRTFARCSSCSLRPFTYTDSGPSIVLKAPTSDRLPPSSPSSSTSLLGTFATLRLFYASASSITSPCACEDMSLRTADPRLRFRPPLLPGSSPRPAPPHPPQLPSFCLLRSLLPNLLPFHAKVQRPRL